MCVRSTVLLQGQAQAWHVAGVQCVSAVRVAQTPPQLSPGVPVPAFVVITEPVP